MNHAYQYCYYSLFEPVLQCVLKLRIRDNMKDIWMITEA